MVNAVVLGILILAVGSAVSYIIKAKKKGTKCIGCSCGCGKDEKHSDCGCGCHSVRKG